MRWKSTESGFRHGNIIVPGMFEELLVMSFSAEPNRRRPYDRDLRWRIVFQRIGMGLQYDKIAQNLNVSTSTAYRICARFDATGEVQPTLNKHRPYLQRLDID